MPKVSQSKEDITRAWLTQWKDYEHFFISNMSTYLFCCYIWYYSTTMGGVHVLLWVWPGNLRCGQSRCQPSSLTDVATLKEKPRGSRVRVVEGTKLLACPPILLASSLLGSSVLVSGHNILAMPKESFIIYSRRDQRALTTDPWLPGPLANQCAGKRPESLIMVLSWEAIRCRSQLLTKGLSRFSIYLQARWTITICCRKRVLTHCMMPTPGTMKLNIIQCSNH